MLLSEDSFSTDHLAAQLGREDSLVIVFKTSPQDFPEALFVGKIRHFLIRFARRRSMEYQEIRKKYHKPAVNNYGDLSQQTNRKGSYGGDGNSDKGNKPQGSLADPATNLLDPADPLNAPE